MDTSAPFDFGPLFAAVQRNNIFPDGKTFADCIPRRAPKDILAEYLRGRESQAATFDLAQFVHENFIVPEAAHVEVPSGEPLEQHIRTLWNALRHQPDRPQPGSSLLALPHPYIVPGGRFREIYYWDSYFTMLGLRESGDEQMIEDMADNFAYLITRFGFIPNGNRTYYLSRSQPPCFALIVELIVERQGRTAYSRYLEPLEAEYHYWMDRSAPTSHVVKLRDGGMLNRYFDQLDTPRLESFAEDEALAERSSQPRSVLLRHLRSAAESGWDFSSRWFADGQTIETIHTTDLVPVDLNCFLYQMELTLAKAFEAAGRSGRQQDLAEAAERRKNAIQATCWSEGYGFYCDYDKGAERVTDRLSLAGVLPLFFKIATPAQAQAVKEKLVDKFLQAGGVVTTLRTTGQQWDAPNGWAPLHWLTICGLEHYGYHELAAEIAHRWIKLNRDVYARTGKLMEKYNVVDVNLEAGGGEYPSQDGFGWTNGVLMKLLSLYHQS